MITLKFGLRTKPLSLRPVFNANVNATNTLCLFDTGARAAMYCRDKDNFDKWCNKIGGAIKVCDVEIRGFGKGSEKGVLYRIPSFRLSDGTNEINFVNFSIVHLPKKTIACEVILPISMIRSMACVLNYAKKDPELLLYSDHTMYFTGFSVETNSLYTFDEDDKEYLNYMKSLEDNS